MQAVLHPGGQEFLDLKAKISATTPGEVPKLSGPVAEGASAAEDFLLEFLDGKPMHEVAWGRVSPDGIARLLALHPLAYTITARPAYIADRAAAPLAARILAGLTGGAKFSVLVGHDTNQAELAGMMGLHWALGGYPPDDPPPGGGLLFVLSKDQATGRDYVTVSYQVQTMPQIRHLLPLTQAQPPAVQILRIPGCGNATAPDSCTLSAFTKMLDGEARP